MQDQNEHQELVVPQFPLFIAHIVGERTMNTTAYVPYSDEPDRLSTRAELWGLLGALVALKAMFAVAILLFGTDGLGDLSSMAGQLAMHWMLVTAALIAVPVLLLRQSSGLPQTDEFQNTDR
jgi:hypothetical protein